MFGILLITGSAPIFKISGEKQVKKKLNESFKVKIRFKQLLNYFLIENL
tara:strand:- start:313 stop:459 length:147 start_codon:yes stop_codon:yes gene_type:complete